MTVKERLIEFIESGKGLSVAAFEKKSGLSNGYVNSIRKSIGPKAIEQISNAFPDLNKVWLLHGVGDMLAFNGEFSAEATEIGDEVGRFTTKSKTNFIELSDGRLIMQTPLIQAKAYAGYLTGWGDEEFISELPTHPIIVEKAHRGEYKSFEASGESMNDGTARAIQPGDILTGRQLDRSHWKNKLHLKKFSEFIIVSLKGILVKEIVSHDPETNIIKCHSYNSDKDLYPDFELNLEEIIQIFNVVQVTKKR